MVSIALTRELMWASLASMQSFAVLPIRYLGTILCARCYKSNDSQVMIWLSFLQSQ